MDKTKNILLFHKSPETAAGLARVIESQVTETTLTQIHALEQAIVAMKKDSWHVIVLAPPSDELAEKVLAMAAKLTTNTPIILALNQCDEKLRAKLIAMGATDAVSSSETMLLALIVKLWAHATLQLPAKPIINQSTATTPQFDPITGTLQRDYFAQQLQAKIKQDLAKQTVLFVLNFDLFSQSHAPLDSQYHNLALSDIAQHLKTFANNEQLSRLDQSSFAIAMEQANESSAEEYAEQLRQWLHNKQLNINNQTFSLDCAIGITTFTNGIDSQTLLTQASSACGIAAARKEGRIHRYHDHDEQTAVSVEDSKWINLVKRAIQEERFRAVFQPIVNLSSAPSEKYEVLLRMIDDSDKEILPGEFLGAAARAGLTTAIDRWVIANACTRLKERLDQGSKTQFFVKLSPESLLDTSLGLYIGEQLRAARLPGASLVFEITEASANAHPKETQAFFAALKQLQCLTAYDHVGVLESPQVSLSTLPADYVKISGSLIANLSTSKANQDRVKKLVQDAKFHNAFTIAQFVQSADTLAYLWQYGINYIQGYYFQRPDTALVYEFTDNDA